MTSSTIVEVSASEDRNAYVHYINGKLTHIIIQGEAGRWDAHKVMYSVEDSDQFRHDLFERLHNLSNGR